MPENKTEANTNPEEASNPEEIKTDEADASNTDDKAAGKTSYEALLAERDKYINLAKRTQAESENFRKRIQRERSSQKRESLSDFLNDFFPSLDDLRRVITEGEKTQDYTTLHDAVKLVHTNMQKMIKKAGISEIQAAGEPFDPKFHEAMTTLPSPDHAPNTVIEVFETGYIMGDFVLRPARVIVADAAPKV